MIIGIPKEIMSGEHRVSATPDTVRKFVQDGFRVLFEAEAGEGALYHDEDYKAAGAEIRTDVKSIYNDADLILKVKEPLFNSALNIHEVDMMKEGQVLITFIHPASPVNHDMVRNLAKRGVISITLDGIPRISRAQQLDALTSMSTCAGYKGIIMAADDMVKFIPPIFSAVGSMPPAKALIIGVGVAGLQALATARRLGATTYAMDIRPAAREQATSLGAKVIETSVPDELGVGEGGYAKHLPNEWLLKEREVIREAIKDMDIVFLSALVPGKIAPVLITEDMVKGMKRGSCIVDISIDQGGNCEITPPGKKEIKHGVILNGIKNIPGMIPQASTYMFSENMYQMVKYFVPGDKLNLDMTDQVVSSALVTNNGEILHVGTKEAMGIA